jgi:3-phenylpropionate/trans-cinnamate dioxygenase ferredoxin reductase subunit
MFSFFKKRSSKSFKAHINGEAIDLRAKETVLDAALREQITFPHSCKVGGCASCKCRLVKGRVRELTDLGYILSEEELDQGYILACQSVPLTDVEVEVDLHAANFKKTYGRVVAQEKLTHDITHLKLLLEENVSYKAGQYANLTLPDHTEVKRSYSFAKPANPDGTVSFFIRKVPGGVFSTAVHDGDLMGGMVMLEGPQGDFWLRPSKTPLLMVAGGSGLAPILAILQDAVGTDRPVTLLFGARTYRDLYAQDEIAALAGQWRAPFTFVPVLSQEPEDSGWDGARGLVTDFIEGSNTTHSHVYLCGPPAMIDAAEMSLLAGGVDKESVFADRFLTAADLAARQVREPLLKAVS